MTETAPLGPCEMAIIERDQRHVPAEDVAMKGAWAAPCFHLYWAANSVGGGVACRDK